MKSHSAPTQCQQGLCQLPVHNRLLLAVGKRFSLTLAEQLDDTSPMLCLQKGMLGHVRYYLSSRGKLPIGIHQFPRLWALPAESSFWYPQFLFDEPLSNLDAVARFTTRNELIKQQKELGTTTIYVTHDQVEAMTMGHRICILNHGEVAQIGRPLEVYQNPVNTFVARFLGNPQMNMLKGAVALQDGGAFLHVCGSSIELPAQALPELRKYAGRAVIVGVRAEDMYNVEPAPLQERLVRIPAQVIAVEPLGAETLLMLALRDTKEAIVARVGREAGVRSGDSTTIALDTAAIRLFDVATNKAIPCFQRPV